MERGRLKLLLQLQLEEVLFHTDRKGAHQFLRGLKMDQ